MCLSPARKQWESPPVTNVAASSVFQVTGLDLTQGFYSFIIIITLPAPCLLIYFWGAEDGDCWSLYQLIYGKGREHTLDKSAHHLLSHLGAI